MRLLLLTAAILPLSACHASWDRDGAGGRTANSSGTAATRNYDATGFTGVDLRGSDDVDVKVGPAFSVRAEGDPKMLDELEIRVVDGILRIGRKSKSGWSWGGHRDGAKIHVTLPKLDNASVAGSGNLDVDKAEGDFSGDVAGSGNLRVGTLAGGTADLDIAGSGNLTIGGGTATKLSASIAGSGDIDAKGVTATSADISIAGSGNVRGTVNGEAEVDIVGSGDVELGGGARCKVDKMGSGDARCS